MKKIYTAIAAAAVVALGANAVTFNNPTEVVDGETYYIVKWDPEKKAFAESNDWEFDETIIFAVDIKGSGLEDWVAETSRNENVLARGIAYNFWPTNGPEGATDNGIDGRLFQIEGTVYGMTVNFFQQYTSRFRDSGLWPSEDYSTYKATTEGEVVTLNSEIFGFGWSASNPGEEWYQQASNGEFAFRCASYTGTKTSPEFSYADFVAEDECPFEGLDAGAFHSMCDAWGGYTTPDHYNDAIAGSGVADIAASNAEVVASEYYNIQGQRLNAAPAKGLYIVKAIKADGSAVVTKAVK